MLLETAFCPPVEWFAAVAEGFTLSPDGVIPSVVYLEACENYQKQSWRNRCLIAAAGGHEALSVPILHDGGGEALPVSEVRVSYQTPWVVRLERAVEAAYASSPFFIHYRDAFFSILESRPDRLFDLNLRLIRFFLEKMGLSADIRLTREYLPAGNGNCGEDLRGAFHPKHPERVPERLRTKKPYYQVFARKYGFIGGLSAMDLLFNESPESLDFLR